MAEKKAIYPAKTTPLDEQETTITIIRTQDAARVYTCDRTMITKLDGLCEKDPEHCKCERMDEYGKWYTLPRKCVRLTASRKAARQYTEKEIEARRIHMKRVNAARIAALAAEHNNETDKN